MLVGTERDETIRRPWPPLAVVLFVVSVGLMIFLAFNLNRDIEIWGLTHNQMWWLGVSAWLSTWLGCGLIVKFAGSR